MDCIICGHTQDLCIVYNGKMMPLCNEHFDYFYSLRNLFLELEDSQVATIQSEEAQPDDENNLRALKKLEMIVFTHHDIMRELYYSWNDEEYQPQSQKPSTES